MMAIRQKKGIAMILLQNGTVIDGSGQAAQRSSVLIDGEKIESVGPIDATADLEIVDCSALVIAPGFIDVHSHADLEFMAQCCDGVYRNYKGPFRRSSQDIWASYRPLCCRVCAFTRPSFKLGRPNGRTDFFLPLRRRE